MKSKYFAYSLIQSRSLHKLVSQSKKKKTLRKHAYSNILKISPPRTESFQIKIMIFFSYFCS